MVDPTYDVGQADDEPVVTYCPGPWWPVAVHYLFAAALAAGVVIAAVR